MKFFKTFSDNYSNYFFSAAVVLMAGILWFTTAKNYQHMRQSEFDNISESLMTDLKDEHGTNIVVYKDGRGIHLSFPYGRSNFVYVINVENYYQLFEP